MVFYDPTRLERGLQERGVRSKGDFGPSVFGRFPDDPANFVGRRVDFMCRRLPADVPREPADAAVLGWLHTGNQSAKWLRQKPVIMLWPAKHQGEVIWDPQTDH